MSEAKRGASGWLCGKPSRTKEAREAKRVYIIILLLLGFLCLLPLNAVIADPEDGSNNQSLTYSNLDDVRINERVNGHVQWIARDQFLIPEGMQFEDAVRTPFLYWRGWANQKLPFGRAFLAYFIILTCLQFILPRVIAQAQSGYRERWLRCFGIGILSITAATVVASVLARLALYMPLATVVMALAQIASLTGLAVASLSLGQSVRRILRLDKQLKSVTFDGLVSLWIGLFLLSFLVLIPGIGPMPRLGNRLLLMISAVGAGAVLRSLRSGARPAPFNAE